MLENESFDVSGQTETLPADEEAVRYISSRSPPENSKLLGFEDYLINTYDDPQLTSQDTAIAHMKNRLSSSNVTGTATCDIRNQISGYPNQVTLDDHMYTDETNLLDETSRFVEKNLNSVASLSEFGQATPNAGGA